MARNYTVELGYLATNRTDGERENGYKINGLNWSRKGGQKESMVFEEENAKGKSNSSLFYDGYFKSANSSEAWSVIDIGLNTQK